MNTKNKVGFIILAVVFVGWTLWSLFGGIIGLTKAGYTEPTLSAEEGKLCEVNVSYAVEAYTITHTLNILIPTGKEHLYLCLSEEECIPLLIKARDSWYNENFDSYGFAKRPLTVTGEVKKMDSQFKKDLADINREVSELGFSISTTKYLSSTYKTKYTLELISALVNIAAAAVMIVMIKRGSGVKVGIVLCILAALFMVFVMLCADTV